MRRTDRLFALIQILRDGRLHKAQDMAATLEVSQRTIYRDMDTLVASGVPVQGERGVGYMITAQITLPPLNLTAEELEVLHLGIAVVEEVGDPDLKAAAKSLSSKVDAVLPEGTRKPPEGWGFAVYPFIEGSNAFHLMPGIRNAVQTRHKLSLTYLAADDIETRRYIWPLNLEYWGKVWTCTAWCELRQDFRVFRVDRIKQLKTLDQSFPDMPGRRYADYLATLADKAVTPPPETHGTDPGEG
ncbi:YafY family protein [Actibacterium sp. 188UL27-1]|uniref:helix-turn-helix transcriptional regulator n=1 Tax=Actibacterium sp. 188UL27-1 TaxID=2786961 RepID=UPI00195DE383|nr:YafY family protein [Actibacterium sp. 188UL27-1]MBM7067874.1 YafY family transcriptional regulator [Actibacterium sp. 188UL27-1]